VAGVDGLVSGIDTGSIVKQLVAAARRPVANLQNQFTEISAKRDALQKFNTLLTDLKSAIEAVDTPTELGAYTASSSQESAITATVSGDAPAGSYGVSVVALATSSIERSAGFASLTDTIDDGVLDIDVGGTLTSITIDAATGTNTPQGLIDYINDNVPGAQAFVLDTGTGSSPFEIVLQGESTGLVNAVTSTMTTTGSGGTPLTFSTVQAAGDAELSIAGATVYTASNTPAGVLPGVTLDLQSVTTGSATITINQDTQATADNVSSVVDAYNALRDFVKQQSGSSEGDGGPLAGDSTLRSVSRRLQSIVGSVPGQGAFAGLRALGLSSSQSGQLEFTSSDFVSALGTSRDDAMNMLIGTGGVFTDLLAEIDVVADPQTGLIQPRLDSFETRMDSLADRVEAQEARLLDYEESLKEQFVGMELILAKYQATGDFLTAQLAMLTNNKNN
jgi:flagellar hook-associated protein 2